MKLLNKLKKLKDDNSGSMIHDLFVDTLVNDPIQAVKSFVFLYDQLNDAAQCHPLEAG
jgi:hypothetical protein